MKSFVVFASAKIDEHWTPQFVHCQNDSSSLILTDSHPVSFCWCHVLPNIRNAHTLTLSFLPSLILFLVSEVTLPPLVFWYIRVRWSFPLRTRARVAQQRMHYATGWKHQLWCRTDRFYYLFINFAATHLADEWRGGQQQVHHFLLT